MSRSTGPGPSPAPSVFAVARSDGRNLLGAAQAKFVGRRQLCSKKCTRRPARIGPSIIRETARSTPSRPRPQACRRLPREAQRLGRTSNDALAGAYACMRVHSGDYWVANPNVVEAPDRGRSHFDPHWTQRGGRCNEEVMCPPAATRSDQLHGGSLEANERELGRVKGKQQMTRNRRTAAAIIVLTVILGAGCNGWRGFGFHATGPEMPRLRHELALQPGMSGLTSAPVVAS